MSQYEFSQVENQTIAKAALWAKVLAGVLIVEGVLSLGNNALGGIADIVMGVVTIQGATALTNVVNSQGRDVPLMVEALDKISNLFLIRLIFAGIAAAGILCLLIVALMAGAASL